MMRLGIAALAGALFGTGLLVSGMTDTARVQGFLDIFGAWDATLAFVMGGAIMPMALAWRVAARRTATGQRAISGGAYPPRPGPSIGRDLALGSVLFGFGWGLVGLCPGPAVALTGIGGPALWLFLAAMLCGMVLPAVLQRRFSPALDSLPRGA